MESVKGYLAIVSGLVLCPCHIPLAAAALAGTAVGSLIADFYGVLVPASALYFAGAIFLGVRWMTHSPTVSCPPREQEQNEARAAIGGPAAEPTSLLSGRSEETGREVALSTRA